MHHTLYYDFDSKRSGCNIEIEIIYEKVKGDTHAADWRIYGEPGHLEVNHVGIMAIEGYDMDGRVIYRLAGNEIDLDWLIDLERAALRWVEEQIDHPLGFLADDLWGDCS